MKPEPHNEIPQAQSAHDTFWDFVSLTPESAHMVLWTMSDRALPRSYRAMEGFGVHTFRLINAEGVSRFVKFHWKPVAGAFSLVWDETLKIAGKDPDFNRRDMWESIEMGDYFEWELGVQVVEEADEHKFDFDLLDPTKIIPEELVPVQKLGKMTLNRNPDNFFAETEQAAFHIGHIVPGIDFTNDPLLQGRLFPTPTPSCCVSVGRTSTRSRSTARCAVPQQPARRLPSPDDPQGPRQLRAQLDRQRLAQGNPPAARAAASSYPERVEGHKIRNRSESFGDHFSQATLFWNSMSEPEKEHIIGAYTFELGKVERVFIRERGQRDPRQHRPGAGPPRCREPRPAGPARRPWRRRRQPRRVRRR